MRMIRKLLMVIIPSGIIAGMTGWAALAILYSDLPGNAVRLVLAGAFVICTIAAFLLLPNRRRAAAAFFVVFCLIVAWWLQITPSNTRNWQQEVAVLPYATVHGNHVTVYNIRNFIYRTEADFDVCYYDKTFDLDALDSVDLIAVYWMGDAIAHIMISFGFQDKDYLVFSIETRKEKGEEYSTLKGFFKQYELIYIAGDERDLIRVRTDYRAPQEDVYLYRTKASSERGRKLFMEYVRQINTMTKNPVWYNTLTTNCTTNIVMHLKTFSEQVHYNWKILLSGYMPFYAYEHGALNTDIPFEKLRQLSYINPKAHSIGNDPEFSRKIREGLSWQKE
jgi:hypothetical protein